MGGWKGGSHEEPGQAKIEIQQVPRCLPDASHSLCPDMTPVPWPTGQFLLLLRHQARDLGLKCSPAPRPLSIHLPYPHLLHLGCDQCPLPDLLLQRPLCPPASVSFRAPITTGNSLVIQSLVCTLSPMLPREPHSHSHWVSLAPASSRPGTQVMLRVSPLNASAGHHPASCPCGCPMAAVRSWLKYDKNTQKNAILFINKSNTLHENKVIKL